MMIVAIVLVVKEVDKQVVAFWRGRKPIRARHDIMPACLQSTLLTG